MSKAYRIGYLLACCSSWVACGICYLRMRAEEAAMANSFCGTRAWPSFVAWAFLWLTIGFPALGTFDAPLGTRHRVAGVLIFYSGFLLLAAFSGLWYGRTHPVWILGLTIPTVSLLAVKVPTRVRVAGHVVVALCLAGFVFLVLNR